MSKRDIIVLDALLVRPQPTGVGRSVLELTRALSEMESEFEFRVLASSPEMFEFLDGREKWSVVACRRAEGSTLRRAFYAQAWLPTMVRRLGGSVVHSMQFIAPLVCGAARVVTVHDLAYLRFPQTVEQPRASYYRWMVPQSLRRAAAIVTNSEATAADVGAYFPRVADRIRVTPFGTPSWVLERPEAPLTPRRSGPFLFVGTLEPRKNLEKLLQAYRLFLDSRPGKGDEIPQLTLVGGRGWLDSGLRPLIEALRAEGHLSVEGYCDGDRLWSLYLSARALLFPSLHEGFGFPILEAMVAGLPVLTADRGAMTEVAGKAALLVNPDSVEAIAEGMSRLIDDNALVERLINDGRERVDLWSWRRCAEATLDVYRSVLIRR